MSQFNAWSVSLFHNLFFAVAGAGWLKRILLIEKDSFVRTDMLQALKTAFPGYEVSAHGALEDVEPSTAPDLLLADAPAIDLGKLLAVRAWSFDDVTCILTGSSQRSDVGDFLRLPRPFTDAMLISVALCGLGAKDRKRGGNGTNFSVRR